MEEKLRQQPSNLVRITVFGPECTGKSTLCQQLAHHFNEPYIIEFARPYLQDKIKAQNQICEPADLLPIAIGQIKLENQANAVTSKMLFCDTNVLLTKVFSELAYGFCHADIEQVATQHQYDLFFLTDIDMPWQADNLRDRRESRVQDFAFFENTLIKYNKPYIKLSGSQNERLKTAINAVSEQQKAKKIGLASQDFIQIYKQKMEVSTIEQQLNFFKNGIQKINIIKAATINDGIFAPSKIGIQEFVAVFESSKNNYNLQKFVPASGAASRMFKFLSEFLLKFNTDSDTINDYIIKENATELSVFINGLEQFPFYESIMSSLESAPNFATWSIDLKHYYFIKLMLVDLDFANKPKGILPFHKYKNQFVTAVEEHLEEANAYAKSNQIAKLHFTISKENENDFKAIIGAKQVANTGLKHIETTFSYQHQYTDTIAVNMQNHPLRNENQQLVFRPGGHGALLENLNNLEADIVFIKNIDNVSAQKFDDMVQNKKLLAGILMSLQKQIFDYINYFEKYKIEEIETFATTKCNIIFEKSYYELQTTDKSTFLKSKLNRPIRVCGMVKNEGEPGGGPFWVLDQNNNLSLQIFESFQIDLKYKNQAEIIKTSTHFNPVDLVCGIKNHKKQKFNLLKYVDFNTGFIVQKNKSGIDLKGFELPGLWNGAMSNWITVFVEVPLLTFNPVKTVNDLLKPAHQNHE